MVAFASAILPLYFVLIKLPGSDKIVSSSYDFAVVDANSFSFLFKNAPEASKFLGISSGLSEENYNSDGGTWVVSELLNLEL